MNKVKLPAFKLIGLKLDGKTTNEGGQSAIDCGNLWQEFEKENFAESIPDKLSDEIYAVYFDYEGDHTQPYSYFIGCNVKTEAKAPQRLTSLDIPEQQYSVLTANGKMPDCVADCWRDIWKSQMERAYGYDFEIYDERSKDWSNAEVNIFISSK